MARILIVDDEPANRSLLHAYLEGSGHELLDADSGERALVIAAEQHPDLVLLDVVLPGLSGFETLEKLKAANRDEFLPVLLITSLSDHASRLHGLRSGADEFLAKPVEQHELLLRMGNLLALRVKEVALASRNVELVELQRFREEMSGMIIHDLKNPLSVIINNLDYVIEDGQVPGDLSEALLDSRAAGHRALRLLANLFDLARMEDGRMSLQRSRIQVATMVEPLLHQRTLLARSRGIRIESHIDHGTVIYADGDLITRVVENVFDNALRHTPTGGRIDLAGSVASGAAQLRIGNSGDRIPPAARERIFEKFGQIAPGVGRMNLGLGLYFCRLAAEAHGGRIWVEETRELPTVFGLELPTAAQPL